MGITKPQHIYRKADSQTDGQTGRQCVKQAGREADRQADKQAGGQRDREAGRQTDRQEGRQAGGQRDRRTERHKCVYNTVVLSVVGKYMLWSHQLVQV